MKKFCSLFCILLVLCLTLGMIPTPIHAEEACSHVYDVYGNCTVCGYYCPHQWVDGSCDLCGCHCQHDYVDMVCTVCAMPCAHSWQEGFCPLCGAVCAHSYEAIITAPSCEEGGYTTYTCACGDSYVAEEVPALGHSYEQGCCTACGAEDPNYIYGELQTATLVTDASALSVGDRIIIAAADYSYALSTTQNTNNRGQANIAKDGSTVTFGTQTQIITLAAGAVEGTFALSVEDGKYLYASSSSSNTLKTQSTLNSNGSWHILISADGTAAITAAGSNTRNTLRYNATSSLFSCYAASSNQKPVVIYVLERLHAHNYEAIVTAPSCEEGGYTTYTCACGDSYVAEEVPALGHSYENGVCGICGQADPDYIPPTEPAVQDYYLIGYINGADYGCESDYQNLGRYKFVDGTLTATFTQDSYVFLKTGDNQNWFMTRSFVQDTWGNFYSTATGAMEKMFVPGNTELTFTLTENTDGSLTLRYTVNEVPVVVPTLTPSGFTLSFEDEILVNLYYTVSDTKDVAEQGMLVFQNDPGEASAAKADAMYTGSNANGYYIATTDGIAAKEMGDDRYYCAYARLTDGTYAYSRLVQYSPKKYATNMLVSEKASAQQKALCVAMLNYGAAAQTYFNYRTDALMNAGLTDAQKALVIDYDAALFTGAVPADPGKIGDFAATAGFSAKSASVSFEGAFAVNYYFAPSAAVKGQVKLYIWNPEDYAAAAVLTAENASQVVAMQAQEGGTYWGQVRGIAAKMLDETYYVAGVYTDEDGNTCSTGIIAYSLSKYCINNAKPGKEMQELAANTAMYGYYAAAYFNK